MKNMICNQGNIELNDNGIPCLFYSNLLSRALGFENLNLNITAFVQL